MGLRIGKKLSRSVSLLWSANGLVRLNLADESTQLPRQVLNDDAA